jgi:starvation-inducible outer membrane lipoprotein
MLLLPLLAVMAAAAQTVPPPEQPRAPVEPRKNQRIERLHVEDRGVRIDELRYGGQTQSVVVQPKGDMPEYESQPTDLARSRPADKRDGLSSATGQRVWNVFKF